MSAASASRPDGPDRDVAHALVRTYLVRALELLEGGGTAELVDSLRHRRWREGVDFSSVHGMLVERTDDLLVSALGALVAGRLDEAKGALETALDQWG